MKEYFVYILASKKDGVLYIGMTGNLIERVYAHRNKLVNGFTQKYYVSKLVYYEVANGLEPALEREKNLKKWKRSWKIELIEKENPTWEDLYKDIIQ